MIGSKRKYVHSGAVLSSILNGFGKKLDMFSKETIGEFLMELVNYLEYLFVEENYEGDLAERQETGKFYPIFCSKCNIITEVFE